VGGRRLPSSISPGSSDLLAAGEPIISVPPKLMAHCRNSGRTYGKSDPIDALAVAPATQREPNLPVARLDGPEREVRLLVDHREPLISERTRLICQATGTSTTSGHRSRAGHRRPIEVLPGGIAAHNPGWDKSRHSFNKVRKG
jgi:hypothetical protein